MKKIILCIAIFTVAIFSVVCVFSSVPTIDFYGYSDASKLVSRFCEMEFDYTNPFIGGPHDFLNERDYVVKTTKHYDETAKKLKVSAADMQIEWAYEVFAIKSYKILDVSVNGNKAIATVSYDVLAKRTGWIPHENKKEGTYYGEAVFVEYKKPNYIEKIKLIFDGKRWWVLDPPFPKVSVDEVISFFDEQMQRLIKSRPELLKPENSWMVPQKLYYEDKRNLMLLKRLSGKYDVCGTLRSAASC